MYPELVKNILILLFVCLLLITVIRKFTKKLQNSKIINLNLLKIFVHKILILIKGYFLPLDQLRVMMMENFLQSHINKLKFVVLAMKNL